MHMLCNYYLSQDVYNFVITSKIPCALLWSILCLPLAPDNHLSPLLLLTRFTYSRILYKWNYLVPTLWSMAFFIHGAFEIYPHYIYLVHPTLFLSFFLLLLFFGLVFHCMDVYHNLFIHLPLASD